MGAGSVRVRAVMATTSLEESKAEECCREVD